MVVMDEGSLSDTGLRVDWHVPDSVHQAKTW